MGIHYKTTTKLPGGYYTRMLRTAFDFSSTVQLPVLYGYMTRLSDKKHVHVADSDGSRTQDTAIIMYKVILSKLTHIRAAIQNCGQDDDERCWSRDYEQASHTYGGENNNF